MSSDLGLIVGGGRIINAGSLLADITSLAVDMQEHPVCGLQLVSSSPTFPNGRTTFCITVITGLRWLRVRYIQASAIVVIEQSIDGSTWDRCKDSDGNESYALTSGAATLTAHAYCKRGI